MNNRQEYVAFGAKKLEREFEALKEGKFESRQLYEFLSRAINDLKSNPVCGIKIPKKLWPNALVKRHGLTNLWKYDLPNGWRLIYTIHTNELMILSVILEWFSHKGYERRFRY